MSDKSKGESQNNYKKELMQDPDYLAYVKRGDSAGVYIVRNKVKNIYTRNKWVDILDIDAEVKEYIYYQKRSARYEPYKYWYEERHDSVWDVRFLQAEIFPRKIHPGYPKYPMYAGQSKEDYQEQVDYICWETATRDIARQREKGVKGPVWEIEVALYDKNAGKTPDKPGDKVNPHWDYRIVSAKKL
ncbi:MAG: hypothetical protein IK083_08460 [Abditibacteriota bacterium]|nr:hypothetical protein [Abditibacteriota bacterium]